MAVGKTGDVRFANMVSVGGQIVLVLFPIVGGLFLVVLLYTFYADAITTDDLGYQIRYNPRTRRREYV